MEAEVTKIIPFISTTKEQDRTAQVVLKLLDANSKIPVGASADVEIIVTQKSDALAIPSTLILGSSGQRHVFKEVDGKILKVAIQTGVGNYERTEVVSGLDVGDVIVYPADEVELKDGLKVTANVEPWPSSK